MTLKPVHGLQGITNLCCCVVCCCRHLSIYKNKKKKFLHFSKRNNISNVANTLLFLFGSLAYVFIFSNEHYIACYAALSLLGAKLLYRTSELDLLFFFIRCIFIFCLKIHTFIKRVEMNLFLFRYLLNWLSAKCTLPSMFSRCCLPGFFYFKKMAPFVGIMRL